MPGGRNASGSERSQLRKGNSAEKSLLIAAGDFCRLLGAYALIFAFKFVYAASRVDKLLLASEERMAVRAYFNADIAFVR